MSCQASMVKAVRVLVLVGVRPEAAGRCQTRMGAGGTACKPHAAAAGTDSYSVHEERRRRKRIVAHNLGAATRTNRGACSTHCGPAVRGVAVLGVHRAGKGLLRPPEITGEYASCCIP